MLGMFTGWFTPTEAGAVAALYALIIAVFVYHSIDLKGIWRAFRDTALQTGVITVMTAASVVMSARGSDRQYWVPTSAREQLPKTGYGKRMFGRLRSIPSFRPSASSLTSVIPGKSAVRSAEWPLSRFM